MSDQMLSYYGINCSICPAYIARQANDIEKLSSLAGEWFDGSTNHAIMFCDGCKSEQRIMK
jgi:hypothetical protein